MNFTSTGIIADIQRTGLIPNNNSTFQTTDILAFINREIQTSIVPMLLSVNENYLLAFTQVPTVTGNQYSIPQNAVGMKLKNVSYADTAQNAITLPRLDISQIASYDNALWQGFYIQNNTINIYPVGSVQSAYLNIWYFRRPNEVVDFTSQAAQITAINGLNLTLSYIPSVFSVGSTISVICGNPGFDTEVEQAIITAINTGSSTITVSALSLVSTNQSINVGDYVALEYQSPVAQIPVECYPLLSLAAACDILQAQGDQQGLQMAMQKYESTKKSIIDMITPRIDDSPKKLIRNSKGVFDQTFRGRSTLRS